jgi:hypothetical protein
VIAFMQSGPFMHQMEKTKTGATRTAKTFLKFRWCEKVWIEDKNGNAIDTLYRSSENLG